MVRNKKEIVDEKKFEQLLLDSAHPSAALVKKILKKAKLKEGLDIPEVAALCDCQDPKLTAEIFKAAGKIKKDIYGERIVLFAPLYISDFCVNDCEYCGFHRRNQMKRRKLTQKEVAEQVKILMDMGHKRLLLEFGEDPKENPIDYVVDCIKTIYKTKSGNGEIRRVNVNIASTSTENYKKLKDAGIGTYQIFQETYHEPTFIKLHHGPKASYERQLFAHDHAFAGGIDDLGIGVLFGLYDWKFEVLSLISHAQYMNKKFGVGPHTISVPRFQSADSVSFKPSHAVSEEELLFIIAILRLAVPYTGMIISTREKPEIRERAFGIGISQTSAGSRVTVGGYKKVDKGVPKHGGQFVTHDARTLEEIVTDLCERDLVPSFCTACYRSGRTGEKFMEIAKPGNIHNFCRPNALLTLKEYLLDYGDKKTRRLGQKIIDKYLTRIPSKKIQKETFRRLARIESGERDLYF